MVMIVLLLAGRYIEELRRGNAARVGQCASSTPEHLVVLLFLTPHHGAENEYAKMTALDRNKFRKMVSESRAKGTIVI